MQQVLLHFSGSIGNIKIFSSIKNLGQYEKLPLDKFVQKKKNILPKHFVVCKIV